MIDVHKDASALDLRIDFASIGDASKADIVPGSTNLQPLAASCTGTGPTDGHAGGQNPGGPDIIILNSCTTF